MKAFHLFLGLALLFVSATAGGAEKMNKSDYYLKQHKPYCYIRKQKCCYEYGVSKVEIKKIVLCHKKFVTEKCTKKCVDKCKKVCKKVPKTEFKRVCRMKTVFKKPKGCGRKNGDDDDDDDGDDDSKKRLKVKKGKKDEGDDDEDDDDSKKGKKGKKDNDDDDDEDDDEDDDDSKKGKKGKKDDEEDDDEDDDDEDDDDDEKKRKCKPVKVMKKVCFDRKVTKVVEKCEKKCKVECKPVCKKVAMFANIVKKVKVVTLSPKVVCYKAWGGIKGGKPRTFTKTKPVGSFLGPKMRKKPASKICAMK